MPYHEKDSRMEQGRVAMQKQPPVMLEILGSGELQCLMLSSHLSNSHVFWTMNQAPSVWDQITL